MLPTWKPTRKFGSNREGRGQLPESYKTGVRDGILGRRDTDMGKVSDINFTNA